MKKLRLLIALASCVILFAGDLASLRQLEEDNRIFELRAELARRGENLGEAVLYRAFGLRRRALGDFFLTAKLWRRGWEAFRKGHRVGLPVGDALRMPGVFLVHQGRVLRAFRHENVADVPGEIARVAGVALTVNCGGSRP